MRKIVFALALLTSVVNVQAQGVARPKLVVGIVVDQMRWDYLYRYYDRYAKDGGFKRLIGQGFTCENTLIPYTPTITACGHSSIFTGTVPAINGITGNNWYDNTENREMYCTEDKSVSTVGGTSAAGQMSPRNLLVTTIGDELRLATNFRSKVVGIALKDRGGILPAGHSANAAYWYDNTTGNWITSTYYMDALPQWVNDFNAKKMVDKFYETGWNTLYPISTYLQSSEDQKAYEAKPFGPNAKGFPYDMKAFIGKNYIAVLPSPMGNTLTAEMAKAAIVGEGLGADEFTDLLTVSFSSPDYIGHSFGPNSIEQEDDFLRLDKELGSFLDFLDSKIGKDQYTVFLSADHGVAHVPGFLKEHKIPAGSSDIASVTSILNTALKEKYGSSKLIVSGDNYQLYLNSEQLDSLHLNRKEVRDWIIDYLKVEPSVARVFALEELSSTTLNAKQKEMITNGYYPKRSGDIQVVLQPQTLEGFVTAGTTHGLWNPYDAHIPLLWYGWGVKSGKTNRETYMTDIAPTLAALLHIQMPSGCVGKVVEEVIR